MCADIHERPANDVEAASGIIEQPTVKPMETGEPILTKITVVTVDPAMKMLPLIAAGFICQDLNKKRICDNDVKQLARCFQELATSVLRVRKCVRMCVRACVHFCRDRMYQWVWCGKRNRTEREREREKEIERRREKERAYYGTLLLLCLYLR